MTPKYILDQSSAREFLLLWINKKLTNARRNLLGVVQKQGDGKQAMERCSVVNTDQLERTRTADS